MKSKAAQYLNEVVSLTMLALMIVALAAGQSSGAMTSGSAAEFESSPNVLEARVEVIASSMLPESETEAPLTKVSADSDRLAFGR
ncbi:MAG: hypothetical protein AAGE85_17565 [Pseudomonadota bacterium]